LDKGHDSDVPVHFCPFIEFIVDVGDEVCGEGGRDGGEEEVVDEPGEEDFVDVEGEGREGEVGGEGLGGFD
jgi:hypothetical protein